MFGAASLWPITNPRCQKPPPHQMVLAPLPPVGAPRYHRAQVKGGRHKFRPGNPVVPGAIPAGDQPAASRRCGTNETGGSHAGGTIAQRTTAQRLVSNGSGGRCQGIQRPTPRTGSALIARSPEAAG